MFLLSILAGLLLCLPASSSALTRDEILNRAREYVAISWDVDANGNGTFEPADTAVSLHDSPRHRYRTAGVGNLRSPIVEWFLRANPYPEGGQDDFLRTVEGAPYAYGKRLTPDQAGDWVTDNCSQHAIGLTGAQFRALKNLGLPDADRRFAAAIDCSGLAGYATEWSHWIDRGTSHMVNDASSQDGYYKMLCNVRTGHCTDSDWDDWQVPFKGDILVKSDHHAMIVVSVTAQDTWVIEATEARAWVRCREGRHIERWDYERFLIEGWRAISVRSLLDNPRTSFARVIAEPAGSSVRVEWTTLFLEETWGFLVQHSRDGESWTAAGEYVFPREPNSGEVQTFSQLVDLPSTSGSPPLLVRVVEVEQRTKALTTSHPVHLVLP